MCGVAGYLDRRGGASEELVRHMANQVRHRGPDDSGAWVDPEAGIALGHRRLSIIDLSQSGHQPMVSASGRLVIAYNGEVYNFGELQKVLRQEGIALRGRSDTEAILETMERRGVAPALDRFIGMFAFALWDREERSLVLGRDRMGIKPMYWGVFGETMLFGSELRALRQHPAFNAEIDRDALSLLLRHGYIPAPYTIFKNVQKLPPGCFVSFRPGRPPQITRYWDVRSVALTGMAHPYHASDEELCEELEPLLMDAVRQRMISDVPLGVFLSGGIDSSLVVALMQEEHSLPVNTFNIGFTDRERDESAQARAVAQHLGTNHTHLIVSDAEAREIVPMIPEIYDEPFADSSQIPTFLVSRLARRDVTVTLSGDGGDETFRGYDRYFHASAFSRTAGKLPSVTRRLAARAIRVVPPRAYAAVGRSILRPLRSLGPRAAHRLYKLSEMLEAESREAFYLTLVSHWSNSTRPLQNHGMDMPAFGGQEDLLSRAGWHDYAALIDQRTYLSDDILCKVDRASMAVSLEVRVPLLDHRVVEWAWRVPAAVHTSGSTGKRLLRMLLKRRIPAKLVDRPKQGFGIPLGSWLRGPLREWADALLTERRLQSDGLFDARVVRRTWHEFLRGERDWEYAMWDVVCFQAWKDKWAPGAGPADVERQAPETSLAAVDQMQIDV